ncbi:MAG: aminotransferase class I/II-fold pyridoxal phosphate-dependent enzyme [Clostridia bacterium]|nr:aminotransferase class I/II-fold pyridoxal phosphate-dependent enzyme [Clostridia bacterium]
MSDEKLRFACDYMEGAHEKILERFVETNRLKSVGYGADEFTQSAIEKIRAACADEQAAVYLLVGGTQTNATVIDALLKPYQGVISADSGHINVHEAGAIEAGGHKVLAVKAKWGKLSARDVEARLKSYRMDVTRDHMVMPGMVYISQPTEYGMLYSLSELEALSAVCRQYKIPLYVDGARLAYALACPENDVTLSDLARLTDAFYIGGTKCGALFGEAVVFPGGRQPEHFFTLVKQHGALLAKGRINGIQFDTLFTDNLYERIGKTAIDAAQRIRAALVQKGYELGIPSPTNQIFINISNEKLEKLDEKLELDRFEPIDEHNTVARIATSWATTDAQVDALISCL